MSKATIATTESETRLVISPGKPDNLCKEWGCRRVKTSYAHRCNECQAVERERWRANSARYHKRRPREGKRKRGKPLKRRLRVDERINLKAPGIGRKASQFLNQLERTTSMPDFYDVSIWVEGAPRAVNSKQFTGRTAQADAEAYATVQRAQIKQRGWTHRVTVSAGMLHK